LLMGESNGGGGGKLRLSDVIRECRRTGARGAYCIRKGRCHGEGRRGKIGLEDYW